MLFRAASVSISLVLDSLRPKASPISGRVDDEAASEADEVDARVSEDADTVDDMGDDGAVFEPIDMALGEAAIVDSLTAPLLPLSFADIEVAPVAATAP